MGDNQTEMYTRTCSWSDLKYSIASLIEHRGFVLLNWESNMNYSITLVSRQKNNNNINDVCNN